MIFNSNLKEIPSKEYFPGFHGKMIHTESMTLAYWKIVAEASIPKHAHMHEQVVNIISGSFYLEVDGNPHHLNTGDILVIPRNVTHGGHALTNCEILDIFQPVREDYRQ